MSDAVRLLKGEREIEEYTRFKLGALEVQGSTLPASNSLEWAVASVPEQWAKRGDIRLGFKGMDSLIPLIAMDKRRAKRFEPRVPVVGYLDGEEVRSCFDHDKPAFVAIDIEDPGGVIELIGVSWDSDCAYVMDGSAESLRTIEYILKNCTPIFHNAAYDVIGLQNALWMDIPLWEDTMVMGAVVDTTIKKNLQRQVLAWVAGTTAWKGLVDWNIGWKKTNAKVDTYRSLWSRILNRVGRPVQDFDDARWWYVFYNGLDVCNTYRLWACQRNKLQSEGRVDYYLDLLKPLHPYLVDMGERGLPVDEEKRAEHIFSLDVRIDGAAEVIKPMASAMMLERAKSYACYVDLLEKERESEHIKAGKRVAFSHAKQLTAARTKLKASERAATKGFNIDSTPQRRAFLKHLGLPELKDRKKKGKVRTDDDALNILLERLDAKCPLGRYKITDKKLAVPRSECMNALHAMIDWKKALTWKRNFCLTDCHPGKPGMRPRMQTEYSLHRAATGRLASGTNADAEKRIKKEQLQNVPEPLRDIYAADPGYVMVGGDLSNIEWALVQWQAARVPGATKDRLGIPRDFHKNLLDRFLRRELDAHRYLASVTYEKGEQYITKDERKSVKAYTHGRNYLGWPKTLAANAGHTLEQGERTCAAHAVAFRPEGWWEVVAANCDDLRYIQTVLGWRRTFHEDWIMPTEIPATEIQAMAADLCKWLLLNICRTCPGAWEVLTTTHDSFLLQVPEADGDEAVAWLKAKMEQPIPWIDDIEFLADVTKGPNWKES